AAATHRRVPWFVDIHLDAVVLAVISADDGWRAAARQMLTWDHAKLADRAAQHNRAPKVCPTRSRANQPPMSCLAGALPLCKAQLVSLRGLLVAPRSSAASAGRERKPATPDAERSAAPGQRGRHDHFR